jgi:hypothetical protein
MAEVPLTLWAVVLGSPEVKRHQLITLAGMLQGALVRCLDLDVIVRTVDADGTSCWPGVDLDVVVSINPFDLELRYA